MKVEERNLGAEKECQPPEEPRGLHPICPYGHLHLSSFRHRGEEVICTQPTSLTEEKHRVNVDMVFSLCANKGYIFLASKKLQN